MGFDLSVYSLFVTVLGCVVNRKFQKVTDKTPLRILYVQNQEKTALYSFLQKTNVLR